MKKLIGILLFSVFAFGNVSSVDALRYMKKHITEHAIITYYEKNLTINTYADPRTQKGKDGVYTIRDIQRIPFKDVRFEDTIYKVTFLKHYLDPESNEFSKTLSSDYILVKDKQLEHLIENNIQELSKNVDKFLPRIPLYKVQNFKYLINRCIAKDIVSPSQCLKNSIGYVNVNKGLDFRKTNISVKPE